MLHLLSNNMFEKTIKLDWATPFRRDDSHNIDILNFNSINGILCLYQEVKRIVLWNPVIENCMYQNSETKVN